MKQNRISFKMILIDHILSDFFVQEVLDDQSLIELYDHHTIRENVYQAFVSDCDEILFLSLKIAEEEEVSLKKHFYWNKYPIKQVHFRQFKLNKVWQDLDLLQKVMIQLQLMFLVEIIYWRLSYFNMV